MPQPGPGAGGVLPSLRHAPGSRGYAISLIWRQFTKEIAMPIILWLLGVPLGIVLLLMLFGVL
jgi:hypothetical protein